jgi:hypothetical protein
VLVKGFKILALIALVSFAFLTTSFVQNDTAMAAEIDNFGIQKIYPTKLGGQEWYVDMDEPRNDSLFRNLDNLALLPNGDSWHVSADQVRMEAWSQENEKWLNVEITAYAKLESGSTELLQLYSRGGHHTDRDQCEGSAYKARLYGDGTAAWTKEITHPAYAGNRGEIQATDIPLQDRWVGFKAVIYNFEEDGNTFVRLESYIDDDVTDSDGNLIVANDWKLASVVEDRGGWATDNSDFNDSCDKERDEILSAPGGTDSQNIVGFRTDGIDWSFKYLSAREIDPLAEQVPETPAEPEPAAPEPETPVVNEPEPVQNPTDQLPPGHLITNSSVLQDGASTISSIDMSIRKITTRTYGDVSVVVAQGSNILGVGHVEAADFGMDYQQVSVPLGPIDVSGDYQVLVLFYGAGYVSLSELHTS